MDAPQSPYQPPQTSSAEVLNRPRRPWLAALLSFLCLGLGQLYAGRPLRSLGWVIIYIAVSYGPYLSLGWIGTLENRPVLWSMIAPALIVWLLNCGDAYRIAARNRADYTTKWWNHPGVYIVYALTFVFGMNLVGYGVKTAFLETFLISHTAMSPTLLPNDRIIVNKLAYRDAMPRRGDICVYRNPEGVPYVMRVIALPGDEIEIRDGRPVINGTVVSREPERIDPEVEEFLQEHASRGPFDNLTGFRETLDGRSYVVFDAKAYPEEEFPSVYNELRTFAPRTVPHDGIFVLGDNRTMSKDSRILGFVHARDIIGRMESRYWRSFDPERERR